MRRSTSLSRFGFALLSLLVSAAIAEAGESPPFAKPNSPTPTSWGICRAVGVAVPGFKPTSLAESRKRAARRTYLTAPMVRTIGETDLSLAFAAFLSQKYGVGNTMPQCGSAQSRSAAEAAIRGWKDENAKYEVQGELIETGWQY